MTASTDPRSGIKHGWSLGESGWNEDMDGNLLLIGQAGFHLSIKDRDLTAPPGSPTAGDAYIVGASATGDWASQDDDVAVYDGVEWVFYTPRIGYIAYLEDEEKLTAFKAAGWSAGIAI